jgi:NADH dehydrogenase (ubiquinone) 1 alpha subcomplex subunit 8
MSSHTSTTTTTSSSSSTHDSHHHHEEHQHKTTPTTPKLDNSSNALYAVAKLIGADCSKVNTEFITCKQQDSNPKTCLEKGQQVTNCVNTILGICQNKCNESFTAYKSCLNDGLPSADAFEKCRTQERALKVCYYRETRPATSENRTTNDS